MASTAKRKTTILRDLINRPDKVLAVMHPPTAAHARIMERAGCEAGFVGTHGVVGNYTGMSDVGTITMMECVMISRWIAESVSFPIIMDGDTGHGGIMAVRRMVRECIHAGVAGVRIDDQPVEGKRATRSAGIEVVAIEHAIARYRAAVDMKDELDPDFVIMAQCYARDAANSDFDDTIRRLKAYKEEAGVDWVQLEAPHSIAEIKTARAAVSGPFSFMKGKLPRYLSRKEHLELGVNLAWYPSVTHHVEWAALWDFMQAFNEKDMGAWDDFVESRKNRPYPTPKDHQSSTPVIGAEGESLVSPHSEGLEKQRELEERYYPPEMLDKYRR